MRFRDQIVWTLLLQGGGAVAGFLAVAILGTQLGAAAQGTFSLVKIEIAFVGSIAILGLTQALFFYVQSSRMSIRRAKELAVMSSLFGAILAAVYGAVVQHWGGMSLLTFALACVTYTGFSCLRGIVLAVSATWKFNVITAAPNVLLLFYAGAAVMWDRVSFLEVALASIITYTLSSMIGLRWLADARQAASVVAREERLPTVMRYGFASGATEVAASVTLLIAAQVVAVRLGAVDLGVFTFAVTLTQGILAPLSFASPLLFKRWMERPGKIEAMKGGIVVFVAIGGLAPITYILLNNSAFESRLGEYSRLTDMLWIVILAAAFDGCKKSLAALAYAEGSPRIPAAAEVLRLIFVATGVYFWPIQQLTDVAWIIGAGSVLSLAVLLVAQNRARWVAL